MTDAPKLKPCPFCRGGITTIEGKGQLWRGQSYGEPQYFQLDHFGQLSETDPFPRCRVEFRCRTEAEAITAWNTRADLIDMDVLRRVEAELRWQEDRRKEALARTALNAPEDPHIEALCERFGYGAVMDAAARLWARKDPNGAFYIGGCVGGTSEPQALSDLRAMMEKLK